MKSWPAYLLQVLSLTFDSYFKVKCDDHTEKIISSFMKIYSPKVAAVALLSLQNSPLDFVCPDKVCHSHIAGMVDTAYNIVSNMAACIRYVS